MAQNADLLFFFAKKPNALPLYEAFAQRVLAQVGAADIRVQKTQISFANRHNFAFASLLPVRKAAQRPDPYLTITFGLERRVDSPRIDAAVEPYPRRWTHHVMIGVAEEIDPELLGWIQEAYDFSACKR